MKTWWLVLGARAARPTQAVVEMLWAEGRDSLEPVEPQRAMTPREGLAGHRLEAELRLVAGSPLEALQARPAVARREALLARGAEALRPGELRAEARTTLARAARERGLPVEHPGVAPRNPGVAPTKNVESSAVLPQADASLAGTTITAWAIQQALAAAGDDASSAHPLLIVEGKCAVMERVRTVFTMVIAGGTAEGIVASRAGAASALNRASVAVGCVRAGAVNPAPGMLIAASTPSATDVPPGENVVPARRMLTAADIPLAMCARAVRAVAARGTLRAKITRRATYAAKGAVELART